MHAAVGRWAGAEYLLWALKGQPLPALLTTSPPGTPLRNAGIIGVEGTSVVFGNQKVDDDLRSGTAGSERAELESAVQTPFDHPPHEVEPKARRARSAERAFAATPSILDGQLEIRAVAELDEDWRRAVLACVRDQLVGDDPEPLRGRGIQRRGLCLDANRHRRAHGDGA